MIKAIETQYKGYRFRSRLEARWAYYYDLIGQPWHYEPEGFDLPDGKRYLPDFYLPDKNKYIEIKPLTEEVRQIKETSVYLAGPMTDWRDVLTNKTHWICGKLLFVGPTIKIENHCRAAGWGDHDWVVKEECEEIKKADIVFAYVDSKSRFGVFAEIGMAFALGKRIIILSKQKWADDLWFINSTTADVYFDAEPMEIFENFLVFPDPEETEKACILSIDYLVDVNFGDPVEKRTASFAGGKMIFPPIEKFEWDNKKIAAALKARSARFEHGETP